ncbi:DUF72 domain-containing protein [Dyella jejuensis]|uniref:DUF72 domain-containing protein n=1 Tax=Dyella jejuensis TaxID=1432009 RepID=A0ABW8JN87_9GAMM
MDADIPAPLPSLYIGCAGWSVPAAHAGLFATDGSHLERYASRFNAVEINSSFYRSHRGATYRRWAASVPDTFRFSVKMIKTVTHVRRLREADDEMRRFLEEVAELEHKLGCVLIQLPPGAAYDGAVADAFFAMLRSHYAGPAVCEPRHASWFAPSVTAMLTRHAIGRVGASPPPHPGADHVAGADAVRYLRLHGTPRIYYDAYSPAFLQQTATHLCSAVAEGAEAWCIFDNTALGHATANALELMALLAGCSVI